jgi:hypothetical protein
MNLAEMNSPAASILFFRFFPRSWLFCSNWPINLAGTCKLSVNGPRLAEKYNKVHWQANFRTRQMSALFSVYKTFFGRYHHLSICIDMQACAPAAFGSGEILKTSLYSEGETPSFQFLWFPKQGSLPSSQPPFCVIIQEDDISLF